MAKQLDFLVFIGRFQPLHRAHVAVIEAALAQAHSVIVLCGSAESARSVRNPWSVLERESMIRGVFDAQDNARLWVRGIEDVPYDDARWVAQVEATVAEIVGEDAKARVGLIGHEKDESSYYLQLFARWSFVAMDNIDGLNATDIRKRYFALQAQEAVAEKDLPQAVVAFLEEFRLKEAYAQLQAVQQAVSDEKARWAHAPKEAVALCAAAWVVCGESVLVMPCVEGVGRLWALPHRRLNQGARLFESAVSAVLATLGGEREDLVAHFSGQWVFDAPKRVDGVREVVQVFGFEFFKEALPTLQGEGCWLARGALQRGDFYADYYDVIEHCWREGFNKW